MLNKEHEANMNTLSNYQKELSVISLFSGCGGMDLGFKGDFDVFDKHYEKNPFKIIFENDIVKKACDTYEFNFHSRPLCGDIRNINITDLPKADIVIGGFPCQDFSLSGKRRGLSSERGKLYLEMKRVIEYVKPLAFVAENVDGIRRNKNGDNSSSLDVILSDFESCGYNVEYQALNAADFGVPQRRIRIIIIGIRKDIPKTMEFPKPSHGEQGAVPWMTSKEAIDDLWDCLDSDNISNHSSKDYSKAKFYPGKKTQGNIQISADSPAPTIRSEHHGNIEGHYRSLNQNEPDNMNFWRRLSVRECARLQSFPDYFEFPCCASDAYKQIGNAVPPILAWNIARALYSSLYG